MDHPIDTKPNVYLCPNCMRKIKYSEYIPEKRKCKYCIGGKK